MHESRLYQPSLLIAIACSALSAVAAMPSRVFTEIISWLAPILAYIYQPTIRDMFARSLLRFAQVAAFVETHGKSFLVLFDNTSRRQVVALT